MLPVFTGSEFLIRQGFAEQAAGLSFQDGRLWFPSGAVNSYFASVAADFIRRRLLEEGRDFTFETVMSHPGKVALLEKARKSGWRTYLYFVATADPAINISRVANRVALGGHPVPENKIVERYHRSLDLLLEAIRHSSRAYIFDNSTDNAAKDGTWIAEVTDGRILELKTSRIPAWFRRAVMDKIA